MSRFAPIKVLQAIEKIYDLLNLKYSKFSMFSVSQKATFQEKLSFVKTFSQDDLNKLNSYYTVQQRVVLAKILEDIMKEIDSAYFNKQSISFQTDLADTFVEFQNQLKNVYIRYNEDENRVLMHYSPIPTYTKDWNNLTLNSRGVVVDLDTYAYVVEPYSKFFNYMEVEATKTENLLDLPYEVAVKLDGSEGILYPAKNGSLRIITKGGFDTEQGQFATQLMRSKYRKIFEFLKDEKVYLDYTLVFEILYDKNDVNRIVVAYDEPDLKLIGVRDLKTGKNLSYQEVISFAHTYELPVTEIEQLTLEEIMELRKTKENFEGWVLRFKNGLYMKIKCEPYLDAHGARFGTSLKAVFNLIKDGKYDDFIASIAPENRGTPESLRKKLVDFATYYMRQVSDAYETIPSIESQKEFALYVQKNIEKKFVSYMFTIRSGREADVFNLTWSGFKSAYDEWELQQADSEETEA